MQDVVLGLIYGLIVLGVIYVSLNPIAFFSGLVCKLIDETCGTNFYSGWRAVCLATFWEEKK